MSNTKNKVNLWDRIMMAITFAEADEATTARELLTPGKNEKRPEKRARKDKEQRPELRA